MFEQEKIERLEHDLVQQLWSLQWTELDAMWDGDANDTFNAMIEEDKPKFTRLEEMMNLYKDAITKAAGKYEEAEGEVSQIVKTR